MPEYQQVLAEIFEHVDYSRTRQIPYNASTYNLERMRALCDLLGNPQNLFPALHIAGSKGKGSTAAMTAAILETAGYRTGLYTSPHLHSFRERMRINSELISQQRLVELWEQAKPSVKALEGTTTFEIITALAFLHFAQPPVDWGVMEVGLGGRLDATNVVRSLACAITSLSYEHTDLLGHTLSLIAFEKAGIIKPGIPVVVGPQMPEPMAVINSVAVQAGARLWRVGTEAEGNVPGQPPFDWQWRIHEMNDRGLHLDISGPGVTIEDIRLPLVGEHQAANATVAVALIHTLQETELNLSPNTIRAGLARAYWPGRLECLNRAPLVLLDSAHNRHSAERLRSAIDLFPHNRLLLLFGASADKDIDGMLDVLAADADEIIITQSFHPRATAPEELAELARQVVPGIPVHTTDDARPALELALALAQADDLILVTGSIFVVAAARESWLALYPQAFPQDDWARQAEPIDGAFTPMLAEPEKKG